ncbi:MAG: xanthine dehydrogenase family protein molybdopterin-binding subunit [Betaproteobacteria bacterium]|nr:xanthine dehydrogenase family protein molybdopterin-binding subunit [Betaproteobacteria bacterium]
MLETTRPKLVGASVKRVEDPRLLTGQGAYTDDFRPNGMLHVGLVRSVHPFARIVHINTAEAKRMPGVIGIFTAADIDGAAKPILATSKMKEYRAVPLPILAKDTVHHVGEAVVAVVATSRYLAEDALRKVEIDYEPLAACTDPEEATRPSAPLVHPSLGSNIALAREFVRGDVPAAMAAAQVRVKGRFRFFRKAALALESRSYLAEFNGGRRELTLHTSTQVPGIVRESLAELLDLPGNSVRVIAPDVGGGFGAKTSVYPEEILVCVLARRLGKPVKYTSDRLEDLSSTSQAFDEVIDAELGVAADGTLLALSADVTGDVGAYSVYPWTAAIEPVQVVSFLPGPYRLANYLGKVRGVITPKVPLGPYRGVGRPVSTFVMERLIDMAAVKLGIDPVAMRLKNLVREDEFPYKVASGIVWDRSAFIECLDAACQKADYAALRTMQHAARAAGRWIGIGIASYAELTGIGSKIPAAPGMPVNTGTETATIRIDATGAVTAIFGVASHGQGLETTLAQIVADDLGVRMEDIRIIQGDTAGRAYVTGTYASRSTVLAGGAAKLAAGAVREKVMLAASHLMEAAVEDLDASNGIIFVRGTDRRMTFKELARKVYVEFSRLPKELQQELEATRLYDPVVGTTSSASHIAMVEVDPISYQVHVLRYVVAEDCGRVVNPMIVEGQVHGGVAQGIGAALLEEVVYSEDGQLMTGSLMDYVLPSATGIPMMDVLHVEAESPSTLGGFRGMGEGGTIGAPAAIANAVSDALSPLGIEINELPATPERIFRLVEQASKQKR